MPEPPSPVTAAPSRPGFRAAAVVVLVRGRGQALEAFWVKRSDAVPTMPGLHAFVGGGVNAEDSGLANAFAAAVDGRLDDTGGFDVLQFLTLEACAIRETFEETGVLLATGARADFATLDVARRALLEGTTDFATLTRERGWRFSPGTMRFIGRWTTPPFSTARFDSAFFMAEVPGDQEPVIHPGELASGEWIAPARALAAWRAGEATFAAPILHVMLELARAADESADPFGDDVLARLRSAPERAGVPVRRVELKWGIVLHPTRTRPLPPATHTNTYLVGDRDLALIDPGSADPTELAALDQLVDTLAADGRRVACILATHDHPDHVAGLDAVRARYGVPVFAHAATRVKADRALGEGDIVPLASARGDWSLRALHTPGHTRGHLCFYHAGTRSLFTGDHIPGGTGTVIIDPPDGDMTDYLASLERLLAEPIETLFPAHGSPQGAAHRRVRALIAHRLEREAKVLAALDAAPRPLAEILERAYADTPRDLWKYAERSLLAHLIKLECESRAARDDERWRRA